MGVGAGLRPGWGKQRGLLCHSALLSPTCPLPRFSIFSPELREAPHLVVTLCWSDSWSLGGGDLAHSCRGARGAAQQWVSTGAAGVQEKPETRDL